MTDRRVRKTLSAIYQALASLLSEKELKDITIRELCERADINKSTFYLHFHDIYDCTDSFLERLAAPVIDVISSYSCEDVLSEAPEMWNRILDVYHDNFSLYAPLFKSSSLMPLLNRMDNFIAEKILSRWQIRDAQAQHKYAITFIIRGFMGVLQEYDLDELRGPVISSLAQKVSRGFRE